MRQPNPSHITPRNTSNPLSHFIRFYALAVKSLTTENIDFIRAVTDYETEIRREIVNASGVANDIMREAAKKLYEKYIKQNCELEVGITKK